MTTPSVKEQVEELVYTAKQLGAFGGKYGCSELDRDVDRMQKQLITSSEETAAELKEMQEAYTEERRVVKMLLAASKETAAELARCKKYLSALPFLGTLVGKVEAR